MRGYVVNLLEIVNEITAQYSQSMDVKVEMYIRERTLFTVIFLTTSSKRNSEY